MSRKITGRPRDESIRKRILETAIEMLVQLGYKNTTMKDIAIQANVSKQTLYRWWNNRAELLMESFVYYAEENVSFPESENGEHDLESFLTNTFQLSNEVTKVLLKTLLGESITDPEFSKVFFEQFISKRQSFLAERISRMKQFKSSSDERIHTLVDIIFGIMWYRLIFGHRPLDSELIKELTQIIMGKPA
jgi:AcrR family transcriptional regulator